MSVVTTIIVCIGNQLKKEEGRYRTPIEKELLALRGGQGFTCISRGDAARVWGGSKYPEADVYGVAFNYLNWDKFVDWFTNLPWVNHTQVRLLVKPDDSQTFAVYQFQQPQGGRYQLVEVLDSEPW